MARITDALRRSMGLRALGARAGATWAKGGMQDAFARMIANMNAGIEFITGNMYFLGHNPLFSLRKKYLSFANNIARHKDVFQAKSVTGGVAGLLRESISSGPGGVFATYGKAANPAHSAFKHAFEPAPVKLKRCLLQLTPGFNNFLHNAFTPKNGQLKENKGGMGRKNSGRNLRQSLFKTLLNSANVFASPLPGWLRALSGMAGAIDNPALKSGMAEASRWLGVTAFNFPPGQGSALWANGRAGKSGANIESASISPDTRGINYDAFVNSGQFRRMVSAGNRGVKQ